MFVCVSAIMVLWCFFFLCFFDNLYPDQYLALSVLIFVGFFRHLTMYFEAFTFEHLAFFDVLMF